MFQKKKKSLLKKIKDKLIKPENSQYSNIFNLEKIFLILVV